MRWGGAGVAGVDKGWWVMSVGRLFPFQGHVLSLAYQTRNGPASVAPQYSLPRAQNRVVGPASLPPGGPEHEEVVLMSKTLSRRSHRGFQNSLWNRELRWVVVWGTGALPAPWGLGRPSRRTSPERSVVTASILSAQGALAQAPTARRAREAITEKGRGHAGSEGERPRVTGPSTQAAEGPADSCRSDVPREALEKAQDRTRFLS